MYGFIVLSIHSMKLNICLFYFFCFFVFQVGAGRTHSNTKSNVHTSIDILFVDVPKNLRVPNISASSSDVPQWNK